MGSNHQKRQAAASKGLSAEEVDSKIECALASILQRLAKIEEKIPSDMPAIGDLRDLVAAEVGKLTPPPAALTPPGSVAEPLGRGLFPCIKSLSKKEHLERLRALIEQ